MAHEVEVLSTRGRVARGLLSTYALLIYVFLFFPIVLLILWESSFTRSGS